MVDISNPVITALRERVSDKGSQKDVANEIGVSTTHLSDVLSGNRNLGGKILDRLGFVKITLHVKKEHVGRVLRVLDATLSGDTRMQKLIDKAIKK